MGKLESLSDVWLGSATRTPLQAQAFETSTISVAVANVGTMPESRQIVPSGAEDKRQPWSVVTTD